MALVGGGDDSTDAVADGGSEDRLVREDSHCLSVAEDGKATIVAFLDFECEPCGAAFPAVEELRAYYGDRITFVVRHFPLLSSRTGAPLPWRCCHSGAAHGSFTARSSARCS